MTQLFLNELTAMNYFTDDYAVFKENVLDKIARNVDFAMKRICGKLYRAKYNYVIKDQNGTVLLKVDDQEMYWHSLDEDVNDVYFMIIDLVDGFRKEIEITEVVKL